MAGCAWRTALLTASVAMRSSSCWRSGTSPSPITRAFEAAGGAAFDGGALGELAQRQLEADALGLVGAQRHHGAARIGEALARQVANAREDGRQRGIARAFVHGFFGRAELHEDAGETLREAVVDFLADAVALGEHGGVLGGHAEFLQADAQA